jgi:catechol 2,3-dioxygenase-like lactoylglutathione lyase family enzyme
MAQSLAFSTFLVHDYDEALSFFKRIGFEVLEDTRLSPEKRWVRVAPKGGQGGGLLLARAANPEQQAQVGKQAGGRVAFFLSTDDFWETYDFLQDQSVRFLEAPRKEVYGMVVVFLDLYGNRWDLLEAPKA